MTQVRREKLQELLKAEASAILLRHVKDPRIGFVSVTEVELSPDFRHAKIFVSVLGDEQAKQRTMEGLQRATGYVRTELGRRIKLRYTPQVLFRLDESIERGSRVSALLRQVVPPPAAAEPAPPAPPEQSSPARRGRSSGDDGDTRANRRGTTGAP